MDTDENHCSFSLLKSFSAECKFAETRFAVTSSYSARVIQKKNPPFKAFLTTDPIAVNKTEGTTLGGVLMRVCTDTRDTSSVLLMPIIKYLNRHRAVLCTENINARIVFEPDTSDLLESVSWEFPAIIGNLTMER